MFRTQEEKQKYIEKIFKDRALFEWEVLHVSSHYDRLEIMEILAKHIVQGKLRFETNFLYLESFKDFKFSQIVNIMFHEIANEWVSFATEVLYYPKREAVKEIQDKTRVKFIHSLALDYYEKYRRKIYEEIADTFIELVASERNDVDTNKLIQDVLQSDLVKHRQILEMHNFSQLFSRVKAAQNIKNTDTQSVKIKISQIKERYQKTKLEIDEKQKLLGLLEKANKELENLKHSGLDKFDPAVKRLKETMVQSMIRMNRLP
ncbi:hypothetical protein [Sulfurimonas sp.]|uniref:hypothetical protein n=1 Tax=Sulfurimonas sp. TaxID=2022749 RepID=UPI00356B0F8C